MPVRHSGLILPKDLSQAQLQILHLSAAPNATSAVLVSPLRIVRPSAPYGLRSEVIDIYRLISESANLS